jgi:hypothetical protein
LLLEIAMTITVRSRKIIALFHTLGLSCVGGAIFLQILVFANIATVGYFRAVESNPTILAVEVLATIISAVYFIYIYQRLIRKTT